MRATRLLLLAFSVLVLGVAGSRADTVVIAGSGTWNTDAPISTWSAPGDTWSFSLTLPNPVAAEPPMDSPLVTDIVSFSYLLDGTAVTIPPDSVTFFASDNGGGFQVNFSAGGVDTTNGFACSDPSLGPCSFDVFGDQLYTNSASDITIQSGTASSVDFDYTAPPLPDGSVNPAGTGSVTSFTVTDIPSVPEPATLSMLAFGALGLVAKRRKK
jgi:hypothetical protein